MPKNTADIFTALEADGLLTIVATWEADDDSLEAWDAIDAPETDAWTMDDEYEPEDFAADRALAMAAGY